MTLDDTTPPDDDELAAAYLDGEASADERARVEADPALLSRVEQFRAVRGAVGSGEVTLDDRTRDAMRARALAEADADADSTDSTDSTEGPPPPAQLDARRRRRGRRSPARLPAPGLVAAAVAVLLLIGAGLIMTAGDQGTSDLRASSESQAGSAGTSASDGQESADAEGEGSERSAAGAGPEAAADDEQMEGLGDFPDADTLRSALIDRPAAPTGAAPTEDSSALDPSGDAPADPHAPPAPGSSAVDRCETVVTNIDTVLGELLEVLQASIDGEPVWVFSHASRDEPSDVTQTVVYQRSCRVVFATAR